MGTYILKMLRRTVNNPLIQRTFYTQHRNFGYVFVKDKVPKESIAIDVDDKQAVILSMGGHFVIEAETQATSYVRKLPEKFGTPDSPLSTVQPEAATKKKD